jgi:hypothetical protein
LETSFFWLGLPLGYQLGSSFQDQKGRWVNRPLRLFHHLNDPDDEYPMQPQEYQWVRPVQNFHQPLVLRVLAPSQTMGDHGAYRRPPSAKQKCRLSSRKEIYD